MNQSSTLQNADRVSGTTLAYGWLCLILGYLFCRAFPVTENPLGAFLLIAVMVTVGFVFFVLQKAKVSLYMILVGVTTVVVASSIILTDNKFLQIIAFAFSVVWYCYFVYVAFENRLEKGASDLLWFDCVKAVVVYPFVSFAAIFTTLARGKTKNGFATLVKILVGGILALIPTALITVLLSYDGGFAEMVRKIFSFGFTDVLEHALSFVFGIPAAMYLFGLFTSSQKKKETYKITAERCYRGFASLKRLPIITTVTASLPILFVYSVFFISQRQYYLSAFTGRVPAEISIAEYARSGFFQLCAVSVINLLVICGVLLFTKKRSGKKSAAVKILSLVFCIYTLILITTAVSKLILYIDTYGLTIKRVYAMWLMIVIALVFLVIALGQFIVRFKWVCAASWISIGCFAILALCNVSGVVANYNTERYLAGSLQTVDLDEMDALGDAAVPALVRLSKHLEATGANGTPIGLWSRVDFLLETKVVAMEERNDTVFSFTLPAHRARKARSEWKK